MRLRHFERGRRHGIDGEDDTGIVAAEFLDHRRQDRARDRVWAPNPHVALGWISQELDVPDALLQFIEGGEPAPMKRATIDRRHYTLRAPIKKTDSKRLL